MKAPPLASVSVQGAGFFSPAHLTPVAARRGERCATRAPAFRLVEGRLRRFTSHGTQMLLEAAGLALDAAGVDPQAVRTVFGSAYGELRTTIDVLEWIASGQAVSPPRFVQSVHSTAAGLLSIATRNHRPSTTVAAGDATVGAALLEAALLLADRPGPVLVVLGEEPIPAELGAARAYEPCACAFVLDAPRAGTPALALGRATATAPPPPGFPTLRDSPIAPALHLAAALEAREEATIGAGPLFGRDDLTIDVSLP